MGSFEVAVPILELPNYLQNHQYIIHFKFNLKRLEPHFQTKMLSYSAELHLEVVFF